MIKTAQECIQKYIAAPPDSIFKPKSPYQLDLEVKDRKPDIVPKVGDKVKIKSREWYDKWKEQNGQVRVGEVFLFDMADACGRILEVEHVTKHGFFLKKKDHTWTLEMFEEVYPSKKETDTEEWGQLFDITPFDDGSLLTGLPPDALTVTGTIHVHKIETVFEGTEPELKQIRTTRLIKINKT